MAAISVSFFVMILSLAISGGFRAEIHQGISDISGDVQLRGSEEPIEITPSYYEQLRSVQGVEKITPAIWKPGIVKGENDICGVLVKGVPMPDSCSLQAIIPEQLARSLALKEGGRFTTYFIEDKVMDVRRHTRMAPRPSAYSIEAPQPQLTGADAARWTRERLVQLGDKYMGGAALTLDPNEVRRLFRPLGYTGTNASDFREAEGILYDYLLEKMAQRALREGNGDLTIVMGPPASGKSLAVRELGLNTAGLTCDGVLSGDGALEDLIRKAKALGFGKITVVPVYNDVLSCFKNSLSRSSGRVTGVDELIAEYRNHAGRLTDLRREFPDVTVKPVDCSHNQGPRPVSYSQALRWNYQVGSADLDKVLSALLDAVNDGDISLGALRATAGDLLSIPGLDVKGQALAGRINSAIAEKLQEYVER